MDVTCIPTQKPKTKHMNWSSFFPLPTRISSLIAVLCDGKIQNIIIWNCAKLCKRKTAESVNNGHPGHFEAWVLKIVKAFLWPACWGTAETVKTDHYHIWSCFSLRCPTESYVTTPTQNEIKRQVGSSYLGDQWMLLELRASCCFHLQVKTLTQIVVWSVIWCVLCFGKLCRLNLTLWCTQTTRCLPHSAIDTQNHCRKHTNNTGWWQVWENG